MSTPLPAISTYLNPDQMPFPFCPGCGHASILEHLDAALVRMGVDPHELVIVSDIGCAGLSDRYFTSNAVHGLHGRSVTYATGIKLANPDLHVVVLIGDGGCGIGGHHLINAARRNVGVTVVVFNNFNYGMTGGEHSVSTPPGAVTATTPLGQIEQPMDICRTVAVNGATFVARTSTFHNDVEDVMLRALQNDGFSLVDVWELCTAYFAPANRMNRKTMDRTVEALGMETGVLVDRPRPEYARAYRQQAAESAGEEAMPAHPVEPRFSSDLEHPLSWLFAGAAGKRIGSAAAALARGGVMSGLWVTQRSDYPVTVRTGYSLSEIILSPEEVLYTGIRSPDVVLDLFPEGHAQIVDRIRALGPEARVYRSAELPEVETRARVVRLDFGSVPGFQRKKDQWALLALGRALADTGAYPLEALREALGASAAQRWAAVEAGIRELPGLS
ncbi:MAG: thiamine pyrophosphate-dependent enzyme [Gemmatimonadota bacterium]